MIPFYIGVAFYFGCNVGIATAIYEIEQVETDEPIQYLKPMGWLAVLTVGTLLVILDNIKGFR